MVVVMPWNDEARRRGLGWREFKPRPTARLRPWWWMEGTGRELAWSRGSLGVREGEGDPEGGLGSP